MNKVIFMGRLTDDPEIKTFERNGETKKCAQYCLAVPRDYTKDKTDFFRCVTFQPRNVAFVQKYFKKGQRVLVEGQMLTDSYTNAEGQKVNTCEVMVQRQEFADGKKDEDENSD